MRDRKRERERQRHRQREKQAPCREPDMGLDPGFPGSHPGLRWPKTTAALGMPHENCLYSVLSQDTRTRDSHSRVREKIRL